MSEKEINVVNLDKPNINNDEKSKNVNNSNVELYPAKRIFAIISFVCGIVGLAICWLGGIGLFLNIPGLVFANIGKISTTKSEYAKKGYKLNGIGIIVNAIISFITFIIWIIVMVLLMQQL